MSESFIEFFNKNNSEIKQVQELLMVPLSDAPAEMSEQVRQAEAWYGRLTTTLAFANWHLDLAEKDALIAKTKDLTDLDREIKKDAAVAYERRFRDVVSGLCDAVRQRVILAQALMKAASQEGRL